MNTLIPVLAARDISSSTSAWGIGEWLIAFIVVLGCIAIAIVVTKVMGFQIPQWVWQVVGIVAAVVVGVIAIKFLLGM